MQDSPDSSLNYPQTAGSGSTKTDVGGAQFRSPLRYATVSSPLTRAQVIQLRSALAAVNTMDMRDGDDDVTSRTIVLTPDPAIKTANASTYYATVYGAEKSPFITEVMVECKTTDGQNGSSPYPYMVLELYNPYSTPINLTNWKLASLTRGAKSITLTEVGDLRNTVLTDRKIPVINPGERLVIESDHTKQPTTLAAKWATTKPKTSTVHPCLNKSNTAGNLLLGSCAGNELVVLRPRRGDGTPTSNSARENYFNEGTADTMTLTDMVPIDQVDLIGIQTGQTAISKITKPVKTSVFALPLCPRQQPHPHPNEHRVALRLSRTVYCRERGSVALGGPSWPVRSEWSGPCLLR